MVGLIDWHGVRKVIRDGVEVLHSDRLEWRA